MDAEEVACNRAKIANNVLPVLLDRAGGSVTVTRADFEAVAARYGGASQMTMAMERVGGGVRVTLMRKPPQQGDPPV